MGIGLYLVWTAKYTRAKQSAFIAFGAQLTLNAAWSLVFFGLHWLWGGALIIVLLLAAIVATIRAFAPISRLAALLLAPYILWVSFATLLNVALAFLN